MQNGMLGLSGYLANGGQDWPLLAKSRPALPAALLHHRWTTHRAQPLAELSQAERSEAPPREARQAAEGGQHFDVSEPREGRHIKLGCDSAAATQLPRPNADLCFSGFVGTARPGLLYLGLPGLAGAPLTEGNSTLDTDSWTLT